MIVDTGSYGICLFSLAKLKSFMKEVKRQRTKKILDLFQNEHELYLQSLQSGGWVPIAGIPSISYKINLADEPKDNYQFFYEGFNLEVFDDGLWICDIGLLLKLDERKFLDQTELSYLTYHDEKLVNGLWFPVKPGKYEVAIGGYDENNMPCFDFQLTAVNEFDGFKDPRETDSYKFQFDSLE